MTILFVLLLLLVGLPLWGWMVARIWKDSPGPTRASFLLIVPAYLWAYHVWRAKDDRLRWLVIANMLVFLLLLVVGYRALQSQAYGVEERIQGGKTVSEWQRWCKEQNDATYDPVLGVCVENSREEALARNESKDIFGSLLAYLNKNGIKADIDRSDSAGALEPKLITEDIAKLTAFYFLPLSMAQPQIYVLLCVSEAACTRYSEGAAERGLTQFVRNGNMILILPPDANTDARMATLAASFGTFGGIKQ